MIFKRLNIKVTLKIRFQTHGFVIRQIFLKLELMHMKYKFKLKCPYLISRFLIHAQSVVR